jgi:hypothetical protein
MKEEAFIIAVKRSDGAAPSIVKTYNDTIFYTLDDAQYVYDTLNRTNWDIFRVEIEVAKMYND